MSQQSTHITWAFLLRVMLKAGALFLLANLIFALVDPLPALGRLSVYNSGPVPGRPRLPYGELPDAYNLSLDSLSAMFAAHRVSQPSAGDDALRVLVIGDSSVWGVLLDNADTLTGQLNAMALSTADGRRLDFINLGHPILSATKDLMLLDYALTVSEADLVLWPLTLDSLDLRTQLEPPLVQANAAHVRDLIARFALPLDPADPRLASAPSLLERTLIGQRRALADWWRLQLYGFTWAATGVDQADIDWTPTRNDLDPDPTWRGLTQDSGLSADALALDVIAAGITRAAVPVLLVNAPVFRADGENSGLRYNAWYPRWAYDQYRAQMAAAAEAAGWAYVDRWDAVPPDQFTDSPVHLTPAGTRQLAESLAAPLMALADGDAAE